MGNLNDYSALDVIATLTELTAQSIAHAVAQFSRNQPELYVCGGGVHNQYLMGRIQSLLPSTAVRSTAHKGIDPDWLEAMAFGWLAARTINNKCRSEEHTSELQSRPHLVCRLLLEKKKKI